MTLAACSRRSTHPADDERAAGPVFYGGPVQTDRGFVLHEPLDASGGHYNATLSVPGGWR